MPETHSDDAGTDAGGGDGSVVTTQATVTLPHAPLESGDIRLTSFTLHVSTLRLVSDRGAEFDPSRSDIGTIDLASRTDLDFPDVPPGAYSAAVLLLDGAASPLDIQALDPVLGAVHVHYDSQLQWTARCERGVSIRPGERLQVGIEVEFESAWEELREARLPAAVDGVITIDDTSAHEALERFLLRLNVHAECH